MTAARNGSPGLRLAIDYAPLLVFVAITFFAPSEPLHQLVGHFTSALNAMDNAKAIVIARVIVATSAFMLATIVAMIVSLAKFGNISPMMWITGVLVVVFGGLTIYFQDQRFIQMKPSFVYAIFGLFLLFGLLTGRPVLEQLLGTAYPGLSAAGWRKLTVNWTIFFFALAGLNEIARQLLSFGAWTLFKFPGCVVITFLFALANVPMMLKHGLIAENNGKAAVGELPPE